MTEKTGTSKERRASSDTRASVDINTPEKAEHYSRVSGYIRENLPDYLQHLKISSPDVLAAALKLASDRIEDLQRRGIDGTPKKNAGPRPVVGGES